MIPEKNCEHIGILHRERDLVTLPGATLLLVVIGWHQCLSAEPPSVSECDCKAL